jgi:ParB-like nuclease domain
LFKSRQGSGRTVAAMLSHSTGFPAVDARNDFLRARRSARAARLLGRRSNVPRTLTDGAGLARGRARLEVIPTDAIVGTLEPTIVFDARFRPASDHVRVRWERIALAHRSGVSLMPITVLERSDGYYVVDGRHRVSVARALGHRDIEARVTRAGAASRAAA